MKTIKSSQEIAQFLQTDEFHNLSLSIKMEIRLRIAQFETLAALKAYINKN